MGTTEDLAPDVVDESETETEGTEPAEGEDALGDKGKQALDRMKAQKAAERTKRLAAEARIKELEAASKPEDADRIRAEAKAEAMGEANARLVRAEVRAAAAGKLTDPGDALQFIDLTQFEVDADGNVDESDIADAIEDLLKNKPYLAAQGGKRFQGSGDGGARNGTAGRNDLHAQIAHATKSGNHQLAIRLRQELAASLKPS